ncbi:sugar transferase [Aminipila sp.]|uniref:sugar transferase n=1 Tax=Aminipila sp. TaxID=2060095 RepID=UPI00289D4E34|nr:sugar transferase [Aminipila sp.]
MYKKYLKRFLDIVIALIALVLLSPVFVVVAILVQMKLGKPAIFKQERPGLHGKIFTLYKFRSMTTETDETGVPLPDELRLTKFGKMLRTTSLDELPELWNILKGEMSLIGPRPLLIQYLPLYNEHQRRRHDVRPGLTGLAQVNGRADLSWQERFDYDVEYVDNVSFAEDLKILLKTIAVVCKAENIENEESGTWYPFMGNDKEDE